MSQISQNMINEIESKFGDQIIVSEQLTRDDTTTIWIERNKLEQVLKFLKSEINLPFKMLYDLTCIDERTRTKRDGQPPSDFSIVYHLTSFLRNQDIRIKAVSYTHLRAHETV